MIGRNGNRRWIFWVVIGFMAVTLWVSKAYGPGTAFGVIVASAYAVAFGTLLERLWKATR